MKIFIYIIVFIISIPPLFAGKYEDAFYNSIGDHPKCLANASRVIRKVENREYDLIDWSEFDFKDEGDKKRAEILINAIEPYLNCLLDQKCAILNSSITVSDEILFTHDDYEYLYDVREKFLKTLKSKIL